MTQSIGPPSLAQGTRIAVGFSTSISRFIPACGELSKPSWAIVQLDGSSPLARGTQDLDRLGYVADRFIPAYAGNSYWQIEVDRSSNGSSPLTRGTHGQRVYGHFLFRFIPAYAGNSKNESLYPSNQPVHPRLRGDLVATIKKIFNGFRFIPAYAGNSC